MDLYVYLEGRWSRIVDVSADIDLDLAIQSAAGSQIELTTNHQTSATSRSTTVNFSSLIILMRS